MIVELPLSVFFFYTVALEIHGNEHPLLVGLESVILCSTHLRVTKMEWLLVGLDFSLAVSQTQEVSLSLDLTSVSLDGAMLKCKVATTYGGVYEKTITTAVKGISLMRIPSLNYLTHFHCQQLKLPFFCSKKH